MATPANHVYKNTNIFLYIYKYSQALLPLKFFRSSSYAISFPSNDSGEGIMKISPILLHFHPAVPVFILGLE